MGRHIAFERLHNFRDLGGYRTADGRTVRWGRLYRSDALSKLVGTDLERFAALGVRTVIDLRHPFEIEAKGRVPEATGVAYHNLSIEHRPVDQAAFGPEVDTTAFYARLHADVAADGVKELARALEVIAAGTSGPLVFHCAAGKDRTGLLAALVLGLMGVSEEDIVADYALSELATARLLADWTAANPERSLRWPGWGTAPADAMRIFLAGLTAEHGSVEGYARARLGADDTLLGALREVLLTD
ncbi:tyrosine-protein phosphatase [Actinacidiphila sp. bgisy160]|uniref:tyrosine-protein phosphatase n=1 Tax=Actinacidiphila sp. bgisy160 TaxID=3413796 RepID=UPI003D74FAE1